MIQRAIRRIFGPNSFATNVSLLLAAVGLFSLFLPVFVTTTIVIAAKRGSITKAAGYLSAIALAVAISIDMLGNVVGRDFLNRTLIKQAGYEFGRNVDTISLVLGVNKGMGTLTDAGRGLANFLNWLDPDHVERAAASLFTTTQL